MILIRPMLCALALLTLAGTPAAAQNGTLCQELWLSRNTIMDRAGQCFRSNLGQALFDNADCVEGAPRLSPLDAELVRAAQEVEAWAGCAVDTSARDLTSGAGPFRDRLPSLLTVPVRSDGESGCLGYIGEDIPLYSGISPATRVIGMVRQDQSFGLSHVPLRGGWQYLEVYGAGAEVISHGWTQGLPNGPDTTFCTNFAG